MHWHGKSAQGRPRNVPSGSLETRLLEPDAAIFRNEVFIVLHGLNLHPDRMLPWCELLRRSGRGVVRVVLAGHDPERPAAWGSVTAEQWLEDLSRAYADARRRWPGAAICLFGYSLGAPLGLVWGIEHEVAWRRIVLLAPALRVRGWLAPLLRLSSLVPRSRVRLPSLAPRRYRAHASTSLSAFHALQVLIERFDAGAARFPRCPQLVIYTAQDELISTRVLQEYRERSPGTVTLHRLALSLARRYPCHLTIDPRTVGEAEWARLAGKVLEWLNREAPAPTVSHTWEALPG